MKATPRRRGKESGTPAKFAIPLYQAVKPVPLPLPRFQPYQPVVIPASVSVSDRMTVGHGVHARLSGKLF